jgi:hypothetical protein
MKEGGEYRQTLNFAFDKLLPKVNLSNSFSNFCSHKKVISPNLILSILANVFLGLVCNGSCECTFPMKEGGEYRETLNFTFDKLVAAKF